MQEEAHQHSGGAKRDQSAAHEDAEPEEEAQASKKARSGAGDEADMEVDTAEQKHGGEAAEQLRGRVDSMLVS